MADLYTKETFKVDDGIASAVFMASGTISPRRPVYATGNLRLNQSVNDSTRYAGIAMQSGVEGDPFVAFHQGTFKVYITGGGNCGDSIVATGITTGGAFRPVLGGNYVSGSVYGAIYASGLNVVGELLQNAADGDLALCYFWK